MALPLNFKRVDEAIAEFRSDMMLDTGLYHAAAARRQPLAYAEDARRRRYQPTHEWALMDAAPGSTVYAQRQRVNSEPQSFLLLSLR